MLRRLVGTSFSGIQTLVAASVIRQNERNIHRYVRPTLFVLMKKRKTNPPPVIPRSTFLEFNYDAEIYGFNRRLNEKFDLDLLRQAFTQKSHIIKEEMRQKDVGIEDPDIKYEDNSKFAKNGEAFMHEYILSYLDAALPNVPKEGIVAIKDHLMSDEILAEVSKGLGTTDLILTAEYPAEKETYVNVFKALVGALIESSSLERAAHFVRDFVITKLYNVDVNELLKIENPTDLLEKLLGESGKVPEYRLIKEIGKNTILACTRVGIYVDKEMFCAGYGENVDIAAEMAAREGLKIFFGTQENMPPIDFKIPGIPNSARLSSQEKITA